MSTNVEYFIINRNKNGTFSLKINKSKERKEKG
jgi:hypothetical protein